MKRIFVNKNDGIAEVVDIVIGDPEHDITLVIPKNASLGNSVSNFRLLKREADAAVKNLRIESVDDDILASAKASRLPSIHPLFRAKKTEGGISDIITTENPSVSRMKEEREVEMAPETTTYEAPTDSVLEEITPRKKKWFFRPKFLFPLGVLVGVLILGFFLAGVFRKAELFINFEELPWEYKNQFLASASQAVIDSSRNLLPAEVFTEEKNITKTFPASGRDYVEEKATGKILIYNAFSSADQVLVGKTRFLASDGKLFRLNSTVTVPGALIKDGKIIPASIETAVTADKPGAEYNLSTSSRLSVPGFEGTPRYQGFYGELIKTSGGFIGERAVPTSAEIETAKEETRKLLISNLESSFKSNEPQGFKILDDAIETKITKLSANTATDDDGNFSVFGEASLNTIGFKEEDLKSLLVLIANPESPDLVFKELNLEFNDVSSDLKGGKLQFSLSANGVLTQGFSPEDFAVQILGEDIDQVRTLVRGLPRLTDAKISIWPRWLERFPKNLDRINIVVD